MGREGSVGAGEGGGRGRGLDGEKRLVEYCSCLKLTASLTVL